MKNMLEEAAKVVKGARDEAKECKQGGLSGQQKVQK